MKNSMLLKQHLDQDTIPYKIGKIKKNLEVKRKSFKNCFSVICKDFKNLLKNFKRSLM